MKKLFYLFIIFACFLFLFSCSSDQEQVVGNQEIGVINFYFENGRYFDVLIEAETLSGEALDNPELRLIIAKTYLEIGHPDRAQEILENLKIEDYELTNIDLLIIESLYKQNKLEEAKQLLLSDNLQSLYQSNKKAILLHAKIELAENNINASKKILLKLEGASEGIGQEQIWLARIDLLENRESKAVERIKKILDEGGEYPEAWLLYANIKFSKKEYLDAENYYLQALRLDNSKILTQQSLQIAQNIVLSKTALGNAAAGEEFYQAFLNSYPKSPIYYFELARLAYSKKDFNTAETNLREVLKTTENNPRVIALLAKILIKQNKLEDVVVLLQKHIVNSIGSLELISLNAITFLELREYQSAIDLLSGYLLEDDRYQAILTPLLAYSHLKNNDLKKYTGLLDSYNINNADSVKAINSIRTIYLEVDKFDEALNFLDKLIEFYPKSNETKVLYLSALNDIGKNEDISEKINLWLAEASSNTTTLRLISVNQAIENGNYRSAITQFNNVDASNLGELEENLVVNNIKNLVFSTRGQDEHQKVFNLLVNWQKLLPNNAQLKLILADIYISEGVYLEAAPLYESLIKQFSNDYVILNNLAWSYFSLGDERALNTAELAYANNSNDAAVCDTLGWILFQKGEKEKGLGFLEQALEIDPGNEAIQKHYELAKDNM